MSDLAASRAVADAVARLPPASSLRAFRRDVERGAVVRLVAVHRVRFGVQRGLRMLAVLTTDGAWVADGRGLRFLHGPMARSLRVPAHHVEVLVPRALLRSTIVGAVHSSRSIEQTIEILRRAVV